MRLYFTIFYFLIFCLFYLTTPAMAQVEKGRLRLGGSISFSFSKSSTEMHYGVSSTKYDEDRSAFSFSPMGGIFLLDGFEVGITPSVSWNKLTSDASAPYVSSSDSRSLNFLIGPYVNYYIGSGEKGKPFIGINPEMGWGKNTQNIFDPQTGTTRPIDGNTKILSVGVTAGYAMFLNDSYLLSFYAGYDYTNSEYNLENDISSDYKTGMFTVGVAISTTFKP